MVWSSPEKVLDTETIIRVKQTAKQALNGLEAELLSESSALHWESDGPSELDTGAHMFIAIQPEWGSALEIGVRLLIGCKCVEILAPFGLTPRLVEPTRHKVSLRRRQPITVPVGTPQFVGLLQWNLRHYPTGDRRMAKLLQRKMELEERIARLESRLSAYERLQVAAQQEWIQGREVPDRERNRERLRRRTVWNRS